MGGFLSRLFGRSGGDNQDGADSPSFELQSSALYSVYNGDKSGNYGIVKILVLQPDAVHLCVYSNEFDSRPEQIDPDTLQVGLNINELKNAAPVKFSIPHLPVHPRDFIYGWQPVLLMESPVTEDELVGYNIWKENGGGVFGGL